MHSETLEKLVVYRALYNDKKFGKNALWIRLKEVFTETILVEGKETLRFKSVNE